MTDTAELQQTELVYFRKSAGGVGSNAWKFWLALFFVALVGALLVTRSSRAGLGVNNDGTAYYGIAKHVMAGDGPRWPFGSRDEELSLTVHFPPLSSMVVGYISKLAGVSDPRVTVAYLHGALIAATMILTGWMVRRYTSSIGLALGGALFICVTADVLDTYASFMSEPVFIFLTIAGMVAVDTGARQKNLAAALALVFLGGVLIGAACWCRYAAIAFVAAAGIGLLFYPKLTWRRRLILAAVAGVPMLAGWWGMSHYVYLVTHASTSRNIRFQPDQLIYLVAILRIPLQWIVPIATGGIVLVLAVAGFFTGASLVARGLRQSDANADDDTDSPLETTTPPNEKTPLTMPWMFVSGALLYIGLLVFSAVCVDPPATPVEPRLIVPCLPMLVIVATWYLHRRLQVARRPNFARAGLAIMIVTLVIGNSTRLYNRLAGDDQYYVGYSAARWRQSETAQWVRKHVPAESLVFCNTANALYYLADRNSLWIPKSRHSRDDPSLRPEFADEVNKMCKDMGRTGFLVCFNDAWPEEFGTATPKEILAAVTDGSLIEHAVTSDGVIYRWTTATTTARAESTPQ